MIADVKYFEGTKYNIKLLNDLDNFIVNNIVVKNKSEYDKIKIKFKYQKK